MSNKEIIRNFVAQKIHDHHLGNNDDIFALGLVNSLFAMELVLFIEKQFNIKVENEDLEITNFSTIHAIDQLISHKLHKQAVEIT